MRAYKVIDVFNNKTHEIKNIIPQIGSTVIFEDDQSIFRYKVMDINYTFFEETGEFDCVIFVRKD